MSLLLQALQKAARNREQASAASPEARAEPIADNRSMLDLEPGEFDPDRSIGRDPSGSDPETAATPAATPPLALETPAFATAARATPRPTFVDGMDEPTPRQAAILMRAAATAKEPRFNAIDWARDHPVYLFAAAACVFLAGYGGYVYLAITQPGLLSGGGFNQQAPAAPRPPVAAANSAGATPPAQTAPSLLPDVTRTPAASGLAQAGTPPQGGATARPEPAPPAPVLPAPRPGTTAGQTDTVQGAGASAPAIPQPPPQVEPVRPIAVAESPAPIAARSGSAPRASRRPTAEVNGNIPTNKLEVRASGSAAAITAQLNEAYAASRKGEAHAAGDIYERVLASDARNVDAMLGLAALAWQGGRTEQASDLYYRILQSEPQNAAAQAGLIGLVGRVDPLASETRLKQLIAREPAGSLYFALGNLYASQGQWAAGQRAYFQAVEADSGNPDYVFNLAVALEHIGQQKPALANYRKALDLSFARGGGGFDQKQVIARIGQLSLAVE